MKSLCSVSLLVMLVVCLSLMSMAAPTVSSISPTSGPTTGGTSVTITGANFVSGATVAFGGTAATGVTVVSSTTITATTPPMAAGTVPVKVTNPDGSSATLSSANLLSNPGFESGRFVLEMERVGRGDRSDRCRQCPQRK
jgi:IPT/TIG domain